MASNSRDVNIRLSVRDAEAAKQALRDFGKTGESALRQIEAATTPASAALNKTSQSAGAARGAAANLGAQVQDMAVQFQMGTSATTILSQQLPQLLSGFGLVGVALGAVVGVGGALVTTFFSAGQSAVDLGKTTQALADTIDRVTESFDKNLAKLGDMSTATRKLIAEQGRLTEQQALGSLGGQLDAVNGPGFLGIGSSVIPTGNIGFNRATVGAATARQGTAARDVQRQLREAVIGGGGASAVRDKAFELGLLDGASQPMLDALAELEKTANTIEAVKAQREAIDILNNQGGGTGGVGGAFGTKGSGSSDRIKVPTADATLTPANRLGDQQQEAAAQEALAAALKKSEQAYRDQLIVQAGVTAARKLGTTATKEQVEAARIAGEQEERARQQIERTNEARSKATQASKAAASQSKQEAEQAAREATTRSKRIDDLAFEATTALELRNANDQGVEAYERTVIAIEAERQVRQLGNDATAEEIEQVRALAIAKGEEDAARAKVTQTRAREAAESKQAQDKADRELKRQAERQADLYMKPFENAMTSLQGTIADTLDDAFHGSIASAQDAADAIFDIMSRMAAELATLALFNPSAVFGGGAPGAAGGAGGAGLIGQAGGLFGGATLGSAAPSVFGAGNTSTYGSVPGGPLSRFSDVSIGGLLGSGALGFAGGSLLSPMLGLNSQGGGIGGGLGAAAGFALGGPLGALGGGLLGTLAGGFLGNAFQKPQDNNAQYQFNLGSGAVSPVTGKNADPANVQITQQIGQAATGFIEALKALGGTFGDVDLELKAGLESGFGLRTIGADGTGTSRSFGSAAELQTGVLRELINQSSGGITAEQRRIAGVSNATTAEDLLADIGLPDLIKSLVDPLDQYRQAIKQINLSYDQTIASAERLGVSTDGLAEARNREIAAVRQQQAQAEAAERENIRQTRVGLGLEGDDPLRLAIDNLRAQFEIAAIDADRLGTTEAELARARRTAERTLIANFREQETEARIAGRRQVQDTLEALGVNKLTPFEQAMQDIARQFEDARRHSDDLGVSIGRLNRAQAEAEAVVRQRAISEATANRDSAADRYANAANGILGNFDSAINPLAAFGQSLRRGAPGTAATSLQRLSRDFTSGVGFANRNGTTADEATSLAETGQAYLEQARQVYGSGVEYQKIFQQVRTQIASVQKANEDARDAFLRSLPAAIRQQADRQVNELVLLRKEFADSRTDYREAMQMLRDVLRGRARV